MPYVGIPRLCQSEACCSDTWCCILFQGHFVSLYRNEASQLRVRTHDFGSGDALVFPCRLGTHNYGDIIVRLWMTGCHYWQSTASVRVFGMYRVLHNILHLLTPRSVDKPSRRWIQPT